MNLVLSGTNTTTLVPSTTTITQVLDDSNIPIDEIPTFITDSDEMELVHAGNDTNFSKTWVTHFDMAAWIYKTTFRFAIGLSFSFTSLANSSCSESWQNIAERYCIPTSGPCLLDVVGL